MNVGIGRQFFDAGRGQHDAAQKILLTGERPRLHDELGQLLRFVFRDPRVAAGDLQVREQHLQHFRLGGVEVDRPTREHAHFGAKGVVVVDDDLVEHDLSAAPAPTMR